MVEAPNDAEASREAGLLLSNLGRDEESAEAFRASVRALRQPETLNNLGVVLARLAKYGEALESVREALRLKPDYEEARRNLAAIERRSREEREPVGGALPSNAKPARVAD
jgi:tetratricopeptide (TPR) repeat protein